jgi:hypothetical protein
MTNLIFNHGRRESEWWYNEQGKPTTEYIDSGSETARWHSRTNIRLQDILQMTMLSVPQAVTELESLVNGKSLNMTEFASFDATITVFGV